MFAELFTLAWTNVAYLIYAGIFGFSALIISEYIKSIDGNERRDKYPFETTVELVRNMDRLLEFSQETQEVVFKESGRQTAKVQVMFQPTVVITQNIENITYILKTNLDNFGKGPVFNYRFKALLGEGIFNVDGEKWYNHRKTSSHLFNLNKFRAGVLDTFNHHGDKLMKILEKNKTLDIASLMFKFTLDSIGVIAFGHDIGALDKENVQFADDFDYCQECINQSFFDPLWLVKRLFTPSGWYYFLCLFRINKFAYSLVTRKRDEISKLSMEERLDDSAASRTSRDLLSLYLARQDKENGGILTDEYLRDVVLNFVIAGRDTTAQALSWSFYLLCCHPDEQYKVQEEIDSVFGIRTGGSYEGAGHATYDELASMKYLEATCMEVLRLYPSVPKEAKHCYHADTLPDGTKLNGGELVVFFPYLMGRDEKLWDEPLQFKPSRFFNTPKVSPFVFTAFQAGPRTCLGQNMAILEMKSVLTRVLRQYTVRLAQEKSTVTYRNSITLPIKGGLLVSLIPRQNISQSI